jgi:(p)ppGpp synthase/HD superfamily hydrolase
LEHGGSEDQAIAALLHDAPEDQGGAETLEEIRARFGNAVAEIVSDCTDSWVEPKPEWRPRKEAYLAKLLSKPKSSLLVSLAEKTHNAEAILFDYRVLGDALWGRFNGGAEGTRWYYQSIAVSSQKRCRAACQIGSCEQQRNSRFEIEVQVTGSFQRLRVTQIVGRVTITNSR